MKWMWRAGFPIVLVVLVVVPAAGAKHGRAATVAAIGVPSGFRVSSFAPAPSGLTNPDDITRLDRRIFVTYQNNANANGTPAGAQSTVVEYAADGTVVNQWNLTGRCDG